MEKTKKELTLTNFMVAVDNLLSQHKSMTLIKLGDSAIGVPNKFIRGTRTEGVFSVAIADEFDYSISKKDANGEYIKTEDGKSPEVKGVKVVEAMAKSYEVQTSGKEIDINLYAK